MKIFVSFPGVWPRKAATQQVALVSALGISRYFFLLPNIYIHNPWLDRKWWEKGHQTTLQKKFKFERSKKYAVRKCKDALK